MGKKIIRNITASDKAAARALRAIWDQKKDELGLTQEKVAQAFCVTQGAISHWLTGKAALGPVAVLRFANLLGVKPTEIRPDFEFNTMPTDLPADVVRITIKLATLNENIRLDLERMIDTLASSSYGKLLDNLQSFSKKSPHLTQ